MPRSSAAGYFTVEDRFERDLELAKKRVTSLPVENASNATPDVEKVGNLFLVSPEHRTSVK
jgi:hypothetical protein